MKRYLVLLLGLAAASAPADRTVPVGIDIGVFLPTDSTVRNTFGDAWFRVGVSPLSFQTPESWKFTLDVAVLSRTDPGGRVLLIPVTAGATRSFGTDATRPYVAVRAGPYYADVFSPPLSINSSGLGFNANASVGVSFEQRFYIEARYDFFSDFEGLDFSGFFLSVGFRLFDVRL